MPARAMRTKYNPRGAFPIGMFHIKNWLTYRKSGDLERAITLDSEDSERAGFSSCKPSQLLLETRPYIGSCAFHTFHRRAKKLAR
jgi:hypothetical protein